MPKKVDYAVRFAFLREAVFQVVRDRGVAALSRRSVAAALGVPLPTVRRLLSPEADLSGLALDEVENRERNAFLDHPRLSRDATALEAATYHVLTLLPRDEGGLATVLVWLHLALSDPEVAVRVAQAHEDGDHDDGGHEGGDLRQRFQLAEAGFVDDEDTPPHEPPVTRDVHQRLADRCQREREVLVRALALIEVHDDRHLTVLSALVRGLSLDLCLGVTTLDEAQATIRGHLAQLG